MIRDARAMLTRLRDEQGVKAIIAACSGGKDSLVVLDLCADVFPEVHGFFLWYVKGLACEETHLKAAERRHGITIHRLPNPTLSAELRISHLRRISQATEQAIPRTLRWNDIERVMRARTGADWFAYGHRITDSLQRRGMLKTRQGLLEKQRRIYPIWDWKPAEVVSYLRAAGIAVPPMYGSGKARTSGVYPGSVDCLLFLKEHYPEDFRKVCEVFPFATAMIARDESRDRHEITCNA